jgi:6-phosphogluconate dehydrogenase
MSNDKQEFGMIGLGRMGGNLSLQALRKNFRVVGYDINKASKELVQAGIKSIRSIKNFRDNLSPPRIVFLYIPAGQNVDQAIEKLIKVLNKGDIIVDGGNSYWGDSIRRYRKLADIGIQFIDVGTNGGIEGARHGACFTVGGDKEIVSQVEPILVKLAKPGGYIHAGPPGAGHFTKLVHNGIEFGMLQAIGEGIALLEKYRDKLDVAEVLRCWRNGSVIRSWLIDLMEEAYRSNGGTNRIPPHVEDTGEVNWLVADAIRMEVPIPIISQSVMQLIESRDEKKSWARSVAMMRHGFGGHPLGASESIGKVRQEGQVGCFLHEYTP